MAVDAKLGRASVAIRGTLDKLDGDLSSARKKVDGAVGRMVGSAGRAFQGLGKVALGGIGVATGAVVGLGAALGKIAIDAAPVEGLSAAFEGLAESAGYGEDEMLAALKRGSAGMVANRNLMATFNEAAQLVSKDFAVQLPDAMQYLSKVSGATSQDMGFLLDSLVKGVGRLSPMILDNLGIQVSLAEATDRAATMFGVEADALDKSQIQAGMMNVVLEKLAENTAAMPDVTDTAAAKMARLKATFQDTKDDIGMAFLPVLGQVMDWIGKLAEQVLPKIMPVIEDLGQAFMGVANLLEGDFGSAFDNLVDLLGEDLAETIVVAAEAISGFLGSLRSGDEPMAAFSTLITGLFPPETAEKIMAIVDGVTQFAQKVAEFLAPIGEWIAENVQLQDILLVIGAAIAKVVLPALISILSPILGIIAIFAILVAAVAAVRTAWETDWGGIRTALTEFWENTGKPALEALWTWLQVSIPAAIETARSFWENTLKPALEKVWAFIQESVIPAIGDLVDWLQVSIPAAIETAKAFWENTLKPALEKVWVFIQESVIPAIGDLVDWLQVSIPAAIETAKTFWENTLKPALEKVWAFIQESVIPAIGDLVAWLQVSIPAAIETAKSFWENTLKPALEKVWAFIQDNVIPIIEEVVTWLETNIPLAIENARKAWEEILKPALEMVWEFIQEDVFPLIEALVDFFNAAFTLAITALAGLWENVLQPALEDVWEFISDSLQPIFEDLEKFWSETLQPAIEDIAEAIGTTLKTAWEDFTKVVEWAQIHILDPMKKVFDGIATAIGDVVEFIKDLTEKIKNIELPDWLTPGSPTPFELGLRGIGDAMRTLSRAELPKLSAELRQVHEVEAITRPEAEPGIGGRQIVIYGLTLEGVQDAEGLLGELQALAI